MEIAKGVEAKFEAGVAEISALDGAIDLKIKAAALLKPAVEGFKADVLSGKIDPIPGTDMDKVAMIAIIEAFEKYAGI